MYSRKNEQKDLIRALVKRVAVTHPVICQKTSSATDEEVRDFIRIFMCAATKYNVCSSYGLKHVAENVIGYIFHGDSVYSYVSNDQFKRIMRESEFVHFQPKEIGNSQNEQYTFRWKSGAEMIFDAFGVHSGLHKGIKEQ